MAETAKRSSRRKVRVGSGGLRQNGQEHRGADRPNDEAPAVSQDGPRRSPNCMRTTRTTRPKSVTWCASWKPDRCPRLKRWRLVEIVEKAK